MSILSALFTTCSCELTAVYAYILFQRMGKGRFGEGRGRAGEIGEENMGGIGGEVRNKGEESVSGRGDERGRDEGIEW